jgi:hypothetical protein
MAGGLYVEVEVEVAFDFPGLVAGTGIYSRHVKVGKKYRKLVFKL